MRIQRRDAEVAEITPRKTIFPTDSFAGLGIFMCSVTWGLRPQALCCRTLRALSLEYVREHHAALSALRINMHDEPGPLAQGGVRDNYISRPSALQKQRFVLRVNAARPAVVFIMKARTTLVRDWSSRQKDPTKVGALILLELDAHA